jgi:hypothetical protein
MKPVRADFVERSRPLHAAWTCTAALSIAVAFVAWDTGRTLARMETLRTEVSARQQQRAEEHRLTREQMTSMPPEVAARFAAFARLDEVDWPQALSVLEATAHGTVTLDAIQIDVGARSVDVDATANDHESIVAYLDGLNAGAQQRAWRWTVREMRTPAIGERHRVALRGIWQ